MMEQLKTLNVAVVGGGPGCKAIIKMILAKKLSRLRMKLIGLASTNPKAVGYLYAQEKGIHTTTDFRDLYKLKDLHMIIELTGRDEVAHEIARTKPDHIRLLDHVAAHLFWDVFDIEEKRIAERKRAQEALEHEKTEKEMILDSLLEHVVYQNLENKVLWANRAASESVDKPLEELVGRYCYEVWAGRQSACEDCPVIKAIETEAPQTIEKTTPDGRSWFIQGYPVRQNGIIVGAVELTLEITERKRTEWALFNSHEKLRSLASELSLAEERQRRSVAIEVHDRISQNLAFGKMKLGAVRASIASSGALEAMDEVLKLVDETIQNTRSLISELGSPILYELGFVPAVEWLTQQAQHQHGIVVDFEDDGQPKPLSEDVRVLYFRQLVSC
jgi:signal transduction histidine kinase